MAARELLNSALKWLEGWCRGGPHVVIGDPGRPYLKRWHVLPRNPWLNVYLHCFLRDDDDRALHDHSWRFCSLILRGGYREVSYAGTRQRKGLGGRWLDQWVDGKKGYDKCEYSPGCVLLRPVGFAHRVELIGGRPCWTLFVTGPRRREWASTARRGGSPGGSS